MVAILSDLFDEPARILAGLKHFRHRRHEVIVFHILDPAELEFPFRATTLFKGLEGMPEVLTEPHALRRAYQAEFERLPGRAQERLPARWISIMSRSGPTRAWTCPSPATWRRGRRGCVRAVDLCREIAGPSRLLQKDAQPPTFLL